MNKMGLRAEVRAGNMSLVSISTETVTEIVEIVELLRIKRDRHKRVGNEI